MGFRPKKYNNNDTCEAKKIENIRIFRTLRFQKIFLFCLIFFHFKNFMIFFAFFFFPFFHVFVFSFLFHVSFFYTPPALMFSVFSRPRRFDFWASVGRVKIGPFEGDPTFVFFMSLFHQFVFFLKKCVFF